MQRESVRSDMTGEPKESTDLSISCGSCEAVEIQPSQKVACSEVCKRKFMYFAIKVGQAIKSIG